MFDGNYVRCSGSTAGELSQEALPPSLGFDKQTVVRPGIYEALNRTAVQFQELQRDTLLNADELLTLVTIATANLQRWQRKARAKGAPPEEVTLVPASQSALARATGTPRQTMRRRLERLIEIDAVRATEQGIIVNFESDAVMALVRTLHGPANPPRAPSAVANDD